MYTRGYTPCNNNLYSDQHKILSGIPLADVPLGLVEGDTAWHQLALEGEWSGHWMGPFSVDRAMIRQMALHQKGSANDIPVYYGHPDIFGGDESAAGWIKTLQSRTNDGQGQLWGQISWTANAAAKIRAKEFRYISPTLLFNTRDPKSGKIGGASLFSAGLTNKPFLEELPEIRLNSVRIDQIKNVDVLTLSREVNLMNEYLKKLAIALGLNPDEKSEEEIANNVIAAIAANKAIVSALGLENTATLADAQNKIRALQNPANVVPMADYQKLQTRLEVLEKSNKERDAKQLVANAQAEGKVLANDTDHYKWALNYAMQDPQGFQACMTSQPRIVPNEPIAPPVDSGNNGEVKIDPLQKEILEQAGVSEEDFKKYANAKIG